MRLALQSVRLAPLLLVAMVVAACGASDQSAPPPAASSVPAAPPATDAAPQLPDFRVVAYQGDASFGGHDGHFSAAFDAGKPVVLLYYGGL